MSKKKTWLPVAGVVVIGIIGPIILVLSRLFFLIVPPVSNANFNNLPQDTIFVGYQKDEDTESPLPFYDTNTHFTDSKGLELMVLFGNKEVLPGNVIENVKLVVVSSADPNKILQEQEQTIGSNISRSEYIPLRADQWPKGKYIIKFYRADRVSAQQEITLE